MMMLLCVLALLASAGKVHADFGLARLSGVIETADATPLVTSAGEARDEALNQYRSQTQSAINDFLIERLFDTGAAASVAVGDIELGEGSTNDTLTFATVLLVPDVKNNDKARDFVQERLSQNNLGNAEGLSALNRIFIAKIEAQNIQEYFSAIRDVTAEASSSMIRMGVGAVLWMLLGLALMS